MKVAIPFLGGGGCQSKSKPWGKLCLDPLNDRLLRTVKN